MESFRSSQRKSLELATKLLFLFASLEAKNADMYLDPSHLVCLMAVVIVFLLRAPITDSHRDLLQSSSDGLSVILFTRLLFQHRARLVPALER